MKSIVGVTSEFALLHFFKKNKMKKNLLRTKVIVTFSCVCDFISQLWLYLFI